MRGNHIWHCWHWNPEFYQPSSCPCHRTERGKPWRAEKKSWLKRRPWLLGFLWGGLGPNHQVSLQAIYARMNVHDSLVPTLVSKLSSPFWLYLDQALVPEAGICFLKLAARSKDSRISFTIWSQSTWTETWLQTFPIWWSWQPKCWRLCTKTKPCCFSIFRIFHVQCREAHIFDNGEELMITVYNSF